MQLTSRTHRTAMDMGPFRSPRTSPDPTGSAGSANDSHPNIMTSTPATGDLPKNSNGSYSSLHHPQPKPKPKPKPQPYASSSSSSSSAAAAAVEERDDSKSYRRQVSKKLTRAPFLFLLVRRLKHQWALLSGGSKVAATLVLLVWCQYIVLGIWDQCFFTFGAGIDAGRMARVQNKQQSTSTSTSTSSSHETSFAVAINTYRRPDRLREAVQHYAETCGRRVGVAQVFVIWAEQHTDIPSVDSLWLGGRDKDKDTSLRSHHTNHKNHPNRATVEILPKSKDSLNSRFEPIPQLQSTAVFMVDDDIRVACSSLWQAFQAWKAHPDSMVGYYPRLASPPRSSRASSDTHTAGTELVYHTWPVVFWTQSFNFVLTKAAFLHSRYLELYTNDNTFPKAAKDHVDQHMNCEDIAMSMLVANYTRHLNGNRAAPPIYVQGSVSDKGLFGGISTGAGHMTTRSDCLTQLTSILVQQQQQQQHGWKPPLGDNPVSLRDYAWIRHAPGVWWQYRPSNFFEWFALANTFT